MLVLVGMIPDGLGRKRGYKWTEGIIDGAELVITNSSHLNIFKLSGNRPLIGPRKTTTSGRGFQRALSVRSSQVSLQQDMGVSDGSRNTCEGLS